jgi:hypothetical protein
MLAHLFDAKLVYRSGMEPLSREGEGELIGSGDGTVVGDSITGALQWTLFERPGRLSCAMNPVALIETDDGARVRLEARGFARRADETSRIWSVAATLRFESDDERYAWLDSSLGAGTANSTLRRTRPATGRI